MRSIVSVALAACVAVFTPVTAAAQGLRAGVVGLSADHSLLGDPLIGGAIGIQARRAGHEILRLEVDWLRGRNERTAIPCAGLIEPGTCPVERVRDDARLVTARGGAAFHLSGNERVASAISLDLAAGWLQVTTRGLSGGRKLDARKFMWGGLLGIEARWKPLEQRALLLDAGAGIGGFLPVIRELVADGYTPFNSGFTLKRARAGITWRP